MAAFASPSVGSARPALVYRMEVLPSEPVSGQAAAYSSLGQFLALSTPLWQGGSNELTFQASVRA
ncbi:MAG TPA: hypothetical protein PLY45_05080, partial [bacterium]|nr:hypothetical protein [bacterium]